MASAPANINPQVRAGLFFQWTMTPLLHSGAAPLLVAMPGPAATLLARAIWVGIVARLVSD